MSSQEGVRLSGVIRGKVKELNTLFEGIDEGTASSAPPGRWSLKEILSHLCGPEGVTFVFPIRAILEQNTPLLDMKPGDSYFTGKRSQMTLEELLAEFRKQYGEMADLVAGLSEEQLARKAHVPMFKETPIGEYPTLAVFVEALAEHHMSFHIDHAGEILTALGKSGAR